MIQSVFKTNTMKYVTSEVVSSAGSLANKNTVDWNDFNYPICLKLFHFNSQQTPEVHRRRVFLFRINHLIVILATFLNLITNIIGTATGVPEGGLRIGLSIFLFLFWIPVSFFLFFYPYHIIMKDQGRAVIFYAISFFTAVWFLIWSIADFADANGFVMVAKNFQEERGAAGIFGVVTAILMLGLFFLNIGNMFMFFKR